MSCWTKSRRAPVASASAKSAAEIEGAAHERAAAGANRADGDRRGDVRFADAGRADQQHAAWVSTKRALANSTILVFGIFGLKVQSKSASVFIDGDAGLFEPAREEPIGASGELVLDEQFEKLEMRERRGFGLRDAAREGLDHAGEPQMTKTGRELWIHRKKSSKVYWVIGRIAGSSVTSVGAGPRRRALDELANGLIAKVLVRVRLGDGGEDALARMAARQAEDALNQANGADAARGERGVGPLLERRADALALADEPIDKRLLTRRGLGLAGARRKHAGRDARVHHDERVAVEDAHEVRVPLHAERAGRAARAAPDRTRRRLRRGHRCGRCARRR